MSDASEVNRLLIDKMPDVATYLLPNGVLKGHEYLVGGLSGEKGESLQITVMGPRAGRFMDFAKGEDKGATPLWLWSKVKGCKFSEAVKQAKEWLGVKDEDFGIHRQHRKTYAKPDKSTIRMTEPNTKVMDYLTITRRIDPTVIVRSRVCETKDGESIVFPFFEMDEETNKEVCVHIKHLRVDRQNGKKEMFASPGTKRCLFGKNLIDDDTREVLICEGEIDCLSWNSWSIPAVSLPNGVSDFNWVETDWEWLARFEKIYISTDMDDPGKMCSQEICKRLGLHRCFIVELPMKDANECLVKGMDRASMQKILASAKQIEMDEIKRPDSFKEEVMDYYTTDWTKRGWDTPWWPTLPWRVRKSEFTVLSGFSGHGKTFLLNQLALHLRSNGCKIMDISLEIKPGLTLYNMTRCAMAKRISTKDQVESCVDWLNDGLFFLDCIGTVGVNRIMHAMEYARKRHGVDIFIIDSLFKCGLSSEDYGGQREFADKLTTFVNNTGAHVILVAHSRKVSSGNEFAVPTKADVAGSSDITNAAFNVLIVWRNKMKKRKLDELKQAGGADAETIAKWEAEFDGKVVIDKQRFGEGEESEVQLWFDHDSTQFHTCPNSRYPYYVPASKK
jgi:twinkle protein